MLNIPFRSSEMLKCVARKAMTKLNKKGFSFNQSRAADHSWSWMTGLKRLCVHCRAILDKISMLHFDSITVHHFFVLFSEIVIHHLSDPLIPHSTPFQLVKSSQVQNQPGHTVHCTQRGLWQLINQEYCFCSINTMNAPATHQTSHGRFPDASDILTYCLLKHRFIRLKLQWRSCGEH